MREALYSSWALCNNCILNKREVLLLKHSCTHSGWHRGCISPRMSALLVAIALASAPLPENPYRAPLLAAVEAASDPIRYQAARRSLAETCQLAGSNACRIDELIYTLAITHAAPDVLAALEAEAAYRREEFVFAECAFRGVGCAS